MYKKIMKLLISHNITAYRLSKDTGIPQSTLSAWKTGKTKPKVDKLLILSKYFGVPIEYFLTDEDKYGG